jgi:hypothetical protein
MSVSDCQLRVSEGRSGLTGLKRKYEIELMKGSKAMARIASGRNPPILFISLAPTAR